MNIFGFGAGSLDGYFYSQVIHSDEPVALLTLHW